MFLYGAFTKRRGDLVLSGGFLGFTDKFEFRNLDSGKVGFTIVTRGQRDISLVIGIEI